MYIESDSNSSSLYIRGKETTHLYPKTNHPVTVKPFMWAVLAACCRSEDEVCATNRLSPSNASGEKIALRECF